MDSLIFGFHFCTDKNSETDSGNIREQSTVKMGPCRDSPCNGSCYIQTFSRPLIDTSHKSRVYLLRMWGLLRLHLGLSIYIQSVQTNTRIALQFLQCLHQSSIVISRIQNIQIFMTNIKLMFPASVSKSKAKACGACCPPSASFPLLPGSNESHCNWWHISDVTPESTHLPIKPAGPHEPCASHHRSTWTCFFSKS